MYSVWKQERVGIYEYYDIADNTMSRVDVDG